MPLMFPRVANNYVKKGFYPTDEATLERILNFLTIKNQGAVRIFDPCSGEGFALKEMQHHLSTQYACDVKSYGVEVDKGRYSLASEYLDIVIHSDFFNCVVDTQVFDLMLFNPPYGDLISDQTRMTAGEKRIEKAFFRRSVGLLKTNGISVMILSYLQLDKNFAERIARNFDDVQVYRAIDPTYKQVVIFGRRVKSHSARACVVNLIGSIKDRIDEIPLIPSQPGGAQYNVPTVSKIGPIKFRTVRITSDIVEAELKRHNGMLWGEFGSIFQTNRSIVPRPLTAMKPWHSAMAIISGCVNGFVTNEHGDKLLIKGSCNKVIKSTIEVNEYEDEDGTVEEKIELHTEQYQAEIMAINFTLNSENYGDIICIT
jgi:hypothetical protein